MTRANAMDPVFESPLRATASLPCPHAIPMPMPMPTPIDADANAARKHHHRVEHACSLAEAVIRCPARHKRLAALPFSRL